MITPKHLTLEEIRSSADEFRRKYIHPVELVPAPIEEIIEFDLGMDIVPIHNLTSKTDIESFISNDLKTISIDSKLYNHHSYENRLRYTYAHEMGHYVLHNQDIQDNNFGSVEEWIKCREEIGENDLIWYEQQAYEFAGRLLVPKNILIQKVKELNQKIVEFRKVYDKSFDEKLIIVLSRIMV